ncbi:MAG: putative inner rane protein translocase component YidC [Frankiales bacterium]|nr:putative inner rane protein translocase component YidC [Frankiales bacterium]
MSGLYNSLGFLAPIVAAMLRGIHAALATLLPAGSGWAWGLSIVLLTISVRILLFPVFVKQIKSQRRMQEIAPKVKELQAKHKGDRETLNTELMKLYKDHGTNPVSGCLPLVLQIPVFIALFRVMNEFKPKSGAFHPAFGLSQTLIEQGAKAKVFGAPISASFTSSSSLLHQLGGTATTVKLVSVIMIVTMGASQFWTQRQLMARAGAPADAQQAQIQKTMLYVLPLFFAVAGVNFPVGVLLYWLTTNVWSMGQQAWVIKRMPPVTPGAVGAGPKGKGGLPKEGEPKRGSRRGKDAAKDEPSKDDGDAQSANGEAAEATVPTPSAVGARAAQRASSGRAAGSRKNKNRKGGRR